MIRVVSLTSAVIFLGIAPLAKGQDSDQRLGGVCFSSIRDNESPARQILALPSSIEQDVVFASRLASSIRTYTVQGTNALIPEFCQKHKVQCMVGAWIGPSRWQNDAQMEQLIHLCDGSNTWIQSVIIGNEVLHREDCDESQLIDYVRQAKAKIDVPIAVADTWRSWVEHPKLAAEVDICGVQIYPYWEGRSVDGAAAYTVQRLKEVQAAYPNKKIVLTEFGWPTNGDRLGQAIASPENAARYYQEIIPLLEQSGMDYYYFAIWDEKWKVGPEGGVGAHWGLYQSDGSVKPAFQSLLPQQVQNGSKRTPRAITFPLAVDQPRNLEARRIAIGGPFEQGSTLEDSQRGIGLQQTSRRVGRSSYSGLRPVQIPDRSTTNPSSKDTSDDRSDASDPTEGAFHSAFQGTTYVTVLTGDEETNTGTAEPGDISDETESVASVDRLHGVCLSLFRDNETPHFGITPLISELKQDVTYASKLAGAVRTYSVSDSFAVVPELCEAIGVDCYPGAALGKYPWLNDLELEMLVRVGNQPNPRIKALIVGNEVMHRGDFSAEQYVQYIRRVKRQVKVPVATAELLHSWMEHPELAAEVDILGVQIYPYWGGVPISDAAENTLNSVLELQRRFPDKPVILTEFGWPTAGGNLSGAVASPENAAKYFREVIPLLEKNDIPYLYFAMTDEKWKQQDEGGPGAHWGWLNSDGSVKACFRDLLPAEASQGLARPPRKLTFED